VRLRNDSGYPLNSIDLGRVIDPGEEFEHTEYITGCTDLDAPGPAADAAAQGTPAAQPAGPAGAASQPPAAPPTPPPAQAAPPAPTPAANPAAAKPSAAKETAE
jgi:hypothetical protein